MNKRPAVEIADVLRDCGLRFVSQFGSVLTVEQRRAVRDLIACRTAALGGHVEVCDQCDEQRVSYNSCRNRHCPKCQGTQTAAWLKREAATVLPVEYFHVVFTLPEEVAALALQNPRAIYGLLFEASWETIRDVAANPKRLGAQLGRHTSLAAFGATDTTGATYDPASDTLWLVDDQTNGLYRLDRSGAYLAAFALAATTPQDVAFDRATGTLLVVDAGSDRFYEYAQDGTLLRSTRIGHHALGAAGVVRDPASGELVLLGDPADEGRPLGGESVPGFLEVVAPGAESERGEE